VERTRFIEHGGRNILFMDFSGVNDKPDALRIIEEARQFVAAQPKKQHLLTLVDVNGSRFDGEIVDALKALARHNQPWVLAGAVAGMSALQRVVYRIINSFSGRRLAAFDSTQEAKDWLVRQAAQTT
jgi:hypothetical protein